MNELALFAGAGGGVLGGQLLGWRTVCAVECNAYAASVLCARQNDSLLPPFPIWDDVCTFDGRPWRGIVDVVSGGFPCQDISPAGKGEGITGERSGLWKEFARIICDVQPRFAFVENSPVLTSRGLGTVLGDLAALGYDAKWGVLGAADVGAPHKRDRIWIVAYAAQYLRDEGRAQSAGQQREARLTDGSYDVANSESVSGGARLCQNGTERNWHQSCHPCRHVSNAAIKGLEERIWSGSRPAQPAIIERDWWATEPDVGRVANGVAARVDRLTAIGNGQVPQCAATAWRLLCRRIER